MSSCIEDEDDDDDIEIDHDSADDWGGSELAGTAFGSPINFSVTTRRISDVYSSYNDHELDTTPAFQRGYVWDMAKASRLVKSVILGVPLPLIYTAEINDGSEVVIDGQQRLLTFIGFLRGEFPADRKEFRLTKMKILHRLNGMRFTDLDRGIQTIFKRYGISIIRIPFTTDERVKFEIFERLNTGAVTLSQQELRNCIYRGSFNDLIKELAQHEAFKRFDITPKRMLDCEMILQFFTFRERTHHNYPGSSMKSFVNEFMKLHQNVLPEQQDEWTRRFLLACDNVLTVFGTDKAFRKFSPGSSRDPNGRWGAFNKAVFDITMFWLSQYEKRQLIPAKDAILDGTIDLMANNNAFVSAITNSTANGNNVKTRFVEFGTMIEAAVVTPANERRAFPRQMKLRLFEANPVCQFCDQIIESIDDAEVDHRMRYALGGSTTWDNARIAHRYCNRAHAHD